jgi:hypothetical protein
MIFENGTFGYPQGFEGPRERPLGSVASIGSVAFGTI